LALLRGLKQKREDAFIEKQLAENEKKADYERKKANLIRQTKKRQIELGIANKVTSTDILLNVPAHLSRPSGDRRLKHKAFNHDDEDIAAETRMAIIQNKTRDPSGQTGMGFGGFSTTAVRRTNAKGVGLAAVSTFN